MLIAVRSNLNGYLRPFAFGTERGINFFKASMNANLPDTALKFEAYSTSGVKGKPFFTADSIANNNCLLGVVENYQQQFQKEKQATTALIRELLGASTPGLSINKLKILNTH